MNFLQFQLADDSGPVTVLMQALIGWGNGWIMVVGGQVFQVKETSAEIQNQLMRSAPRPTAAVDLSKLGKR